MTRKQIEEIVMLCRQINGIDEHLRMLYARLMKSDLPVIKQLEEEKKELQQRIVLIRSRQSK